MSKPDMANRHSNDLGVLLWLDNRCCEFVVAETVIFLLETIALLLEDLNVTLLLGKLLLEVSNLVELASLCQLVGLFTTGRLVTGETLDFIFKTESVEDHDVGSIEDKREEQGEAAKVHVTLSVEFAGLVVGSSGTSQGFRAGND